MCYTCTTRHFFINKTITWKYYLKDIDIEKSMLIQAYFFRSPTSNQRIIYQVRVKGHDLKKRGNVERSSREELSHQCGSIHSTIIVLSVETLQVRVGQNDVFQIIEKENLSSNQDYFIHHTFHRNRGETDFFS